MKTTNKVLAIVLSVMLIMSVLPFAAFAGNTLTVATGADLKTAVANAEDGDTIQFTADITFTAAQVGFKVDKDITFDLNGCTLAGPANGSVGAAVDPLKKTEVMFVTGTEENPTNVTFKDSVGGGSWTYSYSGSSQAFFCDIRDYANVTVLGGTYSADTCKYASAIFYVRSATATLTIEDGNFTSANGPKRDSLVYVNNGSAEINGGTFQSGKSSDYAVSSAQNKVVVINGGEFNGTISGSSNASTESGKSIVINGGTFNDYTGENVKDVTAYIADDVVQDASGTIVPVEATTVAKIGNNQYSTVAAAFAAAPTDGTKTTIKLIADSTSTSNIGVYGGTWSARVGGKNIVLDLNGHTYTQNKTNGTGAFVLAPSQDLTVGNSLTITDTSAGKDGKVTSNSQYTTIQVGTNCTFTLNAGTIENTGTDGTAIQISGTGSATLNNGTVTANDDCYAIYMYEASGNTTPYLKVKGGTISGYCAIATEAEATVDMTGGSIDADYAFIVDGESTVNVTGGTVDASYVGYNYTDTADINISGGTYTSEVPLAYCADGYESVYDAEAGVYVIEVDDHSVAKIGDVRYDSLEEAWNAAVDGDTITLLKNSAGNGLKAPQAKFNDAGLTVDFNGYTYTIDGDLVGSTGTQSQAFQLLMDNNITFQNGTIYSEKARMLVQNYSNLTLDNMVLTLNNTTTAPATVYTLSNNNGNVVIDDTVINANPVNNAYAFDVCRYSSYPSVNVTVTGDSEINGNIEISASKSDPKNGFSLTLESGTMNGDIVMDATAENVMEAAPEKLVISKESTFAADAPEGYIWNADGVLVEDPTVAMIGDVKYDTLEAAWNAAVDGDTITLVKDSAGNGLKAPQAKFNDAGLTVDFNGHTYTIDGDLVGSTGTQSQAFQLLMDNNITFQNGTIYSEKARMLVQNYSNLTLDNMVLTLNNTTTAPATVYTLSNNNGNVVIDDTVINANPVNNAYAFDVCRYSSYPSVNVTVTGDSEINGNVEISASKSDPKNGFSLTLESGTMNGDIVMDATAEAVMEAAPEKLVITKENTFSQDAPEGYKWVDNGDGTSSLEEIVANNGSSLTLNDGVSLNVYLDADAYGLNANEAVVKLTYNHNADVSKEQDIQTDVIPLSEATKYIKLGDPYSGTYKFAFKMAPAQFADDITIELYASAEAAEAAFSATTNVKAKCDQVINLAQTNANYASYAALCGALEDYCVAAQVYFNYNAPATPEYNNEAVTTMDAADMNVPTASVGIDAAGYSFTIVSGLEVNVFYNGELSVTGVSIDSTKGVNDVKAATTVKGDKSCINIKGIASGNFDNLVTVNTTAGDITLAATNIAKAIAGSSNNINYVNLARAMYLYSVQASAYFNC